MQKHCPRYICTGYFPDQTFGSFVGKLRNEDLENQTFSDEIFDLVVHLDVLEHVFDPFSALREMCRTLVAGGRCIFSVPTYNEQAVSSQVAFKSSNQSLHTIGEIEYHANPQSALGSLVTWRYGYDLPLLISRATEFDVEVRRFQSKQAAATGFMTEVYILTK
jgi:SAM-dependent methyltransferase